jgi:methylthioribose-1-phosphate isomerase
MSESASHPTALRLVEPIQWTSAGVVILDQLKLPGQVVYHTYTDYRDVANAITTMVIRGAPAIGVAAAMAIALGVQSSKAKSLEDLRPEFQTICDTLAHTRPTAVDLFWAIERFKRRFESLALAAASNGAGNLEKIRAALIEEALLVHEERRAGDRAIGNFGAALMPESGRVMTQCNAGALATAGIGTALGVIRMAVEAGHKLEILVPETRPYMQGSRLTAWELQQDGIPLVLITDNMVGHFLKTGAVGAVVVGADRIAANGDTANKIGTYGMAVLAKENKVPFYVAAPVSTVDMSLATGDQIPIEERSQQEVTHIAGIRTAPDVKAAHPAFDVTPAHYITAIITDKGIARSPFEQSLRSVANSTNSASTH